MTKNNVFVGEDYCNQGLFVLNIFYMINENASSSAYIANSISLCYVSLRHVNTSYIKKIQTMTRGGKKYNIIFVNDYFRYTELYLFRNKDDTHNAFLYYKSEVEN